MTTFTDQIGVSTTLTDSIGSTNTFTDNTGISTTFTDNVRGSNGVLYDDSSYTYDEDIVWYDGNVDDDFNDLIGVTTTFSLQIGI